MAAFRAARVSTSEHRQDLEDVQELHSCCVEISELLANWRDKRESVQNAVEELVGLVQCATVEMANGGSAPAPSKSPKLLAPRDVGELAALQIPPGAQAEILMNGGAHDQKDLGVSIKREPLQKATHLSSLLVEALSIQGVPTGSSRGNLGAGCLNSVSSMGESVLVRRSGAAVGSCGNVCHINLGEHEPRFSMDSDDGEAAGVGGRGTQDSGGRLYSGDVDDEDDEEFYCPPLKGNEAFSRQVDGDSSSSSSNLGADFDMDKVAFLEEELSRRLRAERNYGLSFGDDDDDWEFMRGILLRQGISALTPIDEASNEDEEQESSGASSEGPRAADGPSREGSVEREWACVPEVGGFREPRRLAPLDRALVGGCRPNPRPEDFNRVLFEEFADKQSTNLSEEVHDGDCPNNAEVAQSDDDSDEVDAEW